MASPVTIQPSSKDTHIYQATATTNYGSEVTLQVWDANGYKQRAVVEIPVTWSGGSPTIPVGATITLAIFSLEYFEYNEFDPVGRTVDCYQLLRPTWVEAEATWNIFKASNNWDTAGASTEGVGKDYEGDHAAQAAFPAGYAWMTFDVTAQVQAAQAAGINVEFLLKFTDETKTISVNDSIPHWHSNNYHPGDDYSHCPKLYIEYTIAATQVSLGGTLNLTGAVTRKPLLKKIGTLNSTGTINRKIKLAKAGTLNLSGTVSKIYRQFKSLTGSLSFAGLVSVLRKIIGAGSVSVDSYLDTDIFHLSKFTSEFTGDVSQIKVCSAGSYNVKVAIYSDSAGEPGSLLSVVNTPTAVVTGWNSITIPGVSVSQGAAYWLAFNSG